MTIGKVTKKNSRPSKTYKFMKKNTNNLTLKDFAELIEFMNETDDGPNNLSRPAGSQANRPVLGLGHYLNQPSRLNNQVPSSGAPPQHVVIDKRNNLFSSTSIAPEKKKENDADRNPLVPAGSRQSLEIQ